VIFSTKIIFRLVLLFCCAVIVPGFAQTKTDTTAPPPVADTVKTTAPAIIYPPAQQVPPPAQYPAAETQPPVSANASTPDSSVRGNNDYLEGKIAGQQDAKGNATWILAGAPGACCYGIGVIGVVCSVLIPPEPPVSKLLGKSSAYILGYTEGFKSKARWKNAVWSSLGCIAGTVVAAAGYLLFMDSLFGSGGY